MKSVKSLLAMAVTVGLVTVGTSTYAIPTLFISDGVGDTEMIADGSATVLTGGPLGVWNLTFGQGTEVSGGSSPSLSLYTLDASIGAPGNAPYHLYVSFGDVNFGPTSSSFLAQFNGSLSGNGSVSYNTFAGVDNELFEKNLGLTSQSSGPLSGLLQGFGGSQSKSEVFPFVYSLTQVITITLTGPGAVSVSALLSDGPTVGSAVPEGGMTLVLLGSSLIALWAFGRFSKSVRT